MTDDQAREFIKRMRGYAISRGAPQDSIDEFPGYAWECYYAKEWRSSVRDIWRNFVRVRRGILGGSKNHFVTAVERRRAEKRFSDGGSPVDYLENYVAAPTPEEPFSQRMDGPSTRLTILIFLLESGWTSQELGRAFPEVDFAESLKTLRTETVFDKELVGAFGSNIKSHDRARDRSSVSPKKVVDPVDLAAFDFSTLD